MFTSIFSVFGPGFRALSAPGFITFLDVVPEDSGIFAFYLAKQNSQLRIGGTGAADVFVDGSIEYHNLKRLDPDKAGRFIFSYLALDGGQVSMIHSDPHGIKEAEIATGVLATIESGTNMILAPRKYVDEIYAKISGSLTCRPVTMSFHV